MSEIIIKTKWDTAGVKALMRELQPPRLNQALSAAVNQTAEQVERKAESLAAKALGVPVKRTKIGIWIRPYSNPGTLTAVVRGSDSKIPLKVFNAKEKRGGVTAKPLGVPQFYQGAFIYGGPRKPHKSDIGMGGNVFERKGSARLPIRKLPGASIADAMAKDIISQVNESYGVERLEINVMSKLARYARVRSK